MNALRYRCSACCRTKKEWSRNRFCWVKPPYSYHFKKNRQCTHISLGRKKYLSEKSLRVSLTSKRQRKIKQKPRWACVCVCAHTRACASSVFGVSFCSALMKEFMFNSTAHPHIWRPSCYTTFVLLHTSLYLAKWVLLSTVSLCR